MEAKALEIKGTFLFNFPKKEDDRGYFNRVFCATEFAALGLNVNVLQSSVSFNKKKGTIRGMHFQLSPHEEDKIIKCLQGSVFDVIVDIRPNSPTFLKWISVDLNAESSNVLYIPKGCAHGFQTLNDNSSLLYFMTENFHPESARGFLWNDERIGIKWPLKDVIISPNDQKLPTAELLFNSAIEKDFCTKNS